MKHLVKIYQFANSDEPASDKMQNYIKFTNFSLVLELQWKNIMITQ